jgi:hypothetical protein
MKYVPTPKEIDEKLGLMGNAEKPRCKFILSSERRCYHDQ